jgi:hypothetical protein
VVVGRGGVDEVVDGVVPVVELMLVLVVGAVSAPEKSGSAQPALGAVDPVWPGMRTFPAQPKLEKVDSLTMDVPSENMAVDCVRRMNPAKSIDTSTVVPVKPCTPSAPRASVMAVYTCGVSPETSASWLGVFEI